MSISLQREAPPDAEWWDVALLPNKHYDDVSNLDIGQLNIRTENSPITIYIQHPIPIVAPSDKNSIEAKPLMLTKKVRPHAFRAAFHSYRFSVDGADFLL